MNKIGKLAGKETICVMTNMEEPLGYAVGNNLEVIEAVKFLRGDMSEDVKEVFTFLGFKKIDKQKVFFDETIFTKTNYKDNEVYVKKIN